MRDLSQPASFDVLRQFVRRKAPSESCEMCGRGVPADHQHLLDPGTRKLVCACDVCAVLFQSLQREGRAKYKRVPRRVLYMPAFRLSDSRWDELMLPINMAFFFKNSPQNRTIVLYPGAAGATESLLSLDAWERIELENPVLLEMEPDVEAFLVNRIGQSRGFAEPEYYIVPIDECFKLTGIIRSRWQGFSGGEDVWREIAEFFGALKARSFDAPGVSHA